VVDGKFRIAQLRAAASTDSAGAQAAAGADSRLIGIKG
jgi:hypothetical protein